jgi:hypothetical protein
MGNKAKLSGNLLQLNAQRVSKKRGSNPPLPPIAKRKATTQNTARPRTSDSGSTTHSGMSAESKDEEFSKYLLSAFVSDVLRFLGLKDTTKLAWPETPYYVELALRYWTILQD